MSLVNEIPAKQFLVERLRNGGEFTMDVDGSSTPIDFTYTVPSSDNYAVISVLLFSMRTANAFLLGGFGNLSALTNGLDIIINGVTIDNWKTNDDIAAAMHDFKSGGLLYNLPTRVAKARWEFDKGRPGSHGIKVPSGASFIVRVNDNLSSLSFFCMTVQGQVEN